MPITDQALHISDMFRINARVYTSAAVRELIAEAADDPALAVCVDVDALERSRLARVDRVMRLALAALLDAGITVALVARDARPRAEQLHAALPGSIDLEALAPGTPCLWLTDDRSRLARLARTDCAIALGDRLHARPNIAPSNDLGVRAALWWLVDCRTRSLSRAAS
jgi:hypothetical protein